jgi:hypothetical protein
MKIVTVQGKVVEKAEGSYTQESGLIESGLSEQLVERYLFSFFDLARKAARSVLEGVI